ncbi:MAG: hypothetical protein ACYDA6_08280, partial [Solirubrobacteraceae bacterium]
LLLTLIAAVGAVLLVATDRKLELPVSAGMIAGALGLLSAIFVLYRIIDHPSGGASFAGGSGSYGAEIGLYLGFIATLAITAGGYFAMQDDGISLADVRDQAAGALSSATAPAATAAPPAAAPPESGGYAAEAAPEAPAPSDPAAPPGEIPGG